MNKLKQTILVLLSAVCISVFATENASSYSYEQPIELKGTKKVGPDGYPYLYLSSPIAATLEPGAVDEGFSPPEKNVTKIQIAVDGNKLTKGADIPNSCVIIKGKLFHAENENHKTKVLISAEDFSPCN